MQIPTAEVVSTTRTEPLISQKPLHEEAKSFCSLNLPLPMEQKELFVPQPSEACHNVQQLMCHTTDSTFQSPLLLIQRETFL